MNSNGWGLNSQDIVNPFANVSKTWGTETLNSDKPSNIFSLFSVDQINISFHFGTGKKFESKTKPETSFTANIINIPLVFDMPKQPVIKQKEEEVDDTFKAPFADTKTGEEDDEILFQKKARLYDVRIGEDGKPENVEIALDELHFNRCNGFYRIVMRRGITYNCLNFRIFKKMVPKQLGKNHNFISFVMLDEGKVKKKLLQFECKEHADELMQLWTKAIDEIKE